VRSGVLELNVDPRFITPPDSELPRIQSERDLVVAVSSRSHNTPRLWHGSFLRPRSTRITANFGQRRQFNGEFRSLHMGVDLDGAIGTPVIASNRGVVVIVHDFYYAGNAIHIDHGTGLTTAYMHLSEMSVAVGDTVARGEVIGKVGATGRVTGPHLHWHAKYGLLTVNPLSLLDVDPVAAPLNGGR
jgi:murein DD-endopeptidase MepM/ murein hydrolase activator NlpD